MYYLFPNVDKLDFSQIAGEKVKWYSHSGKQYSTYESKNTYHMIQQSHPWAFFPEKWKLTYLHGNLYMNVSSSFIHISPKLAVAQVSFSSEWLNTVWCISSMAYHSTIKKEWTTVERKNLDGFQESYPEWKEPIWKVYVIFDSIYMTFLKYYCCTREQTSGSK